MQRLLILITLLLLPALVAGYFFEINPSTGYEINGAHSITLTPEREKHILYGDTRGGGHKYGMNKPCKSEFPQSWSDEQILDTTLQIAANDNLNWHRGHNGYYVTEHIVKNIKMRVVVNRKKGEIVTAYPVNVPRNPCPSASNDNRP
jgi:hypothetical protein